MVETVTAAPAPPAPADAVAPPRTQTPEELYESLDEEPKAELIDGEIITMPPATIRHSRTSDMILTLTRLFVEAQGLGEVFSNAGMRLGEQRYVPDVAFVASAHADRMQETHIAGAADLVVEVISPSDTYSEVEEKVADWLNAGTQAVVVVDPRRRMVKVHRSVTDATVLTESDTLAVDDVVPGWEMPVREIFE